MKTYQNAQLKQFAQAMQYLNFLHSPEANKAFSEFAEENFDELDFENMDKESAGLFLQLFTWSMFFMRLAQTDPTILFIVPEPLKKAMVNLTNGLSPYEKVLKFVSEGGNVEDMEQRVMGAMMKEVDLSKTVNVADFKQKLGRV